MRGQRINGYRGRAAGARGSEPLVKEFPQEGEIPVNWEQFDLKIRELRESHTSRGIASPLLFRGQKDAEWKLQTTLERRNKSNMLFHNCYAVISRIKPQIEAFTKQLWSIPDFVSIMRLLDDYDTFSLDLDNGKFPAQEYMVYLRHHGFPSPLLDWTRSAYIAAYFAFSSEHRPVQGQVSVYCFLDAPENSKTTSNREPVIRRLGVPLQDQEHPGHFLHPRHFLQQADYTVCLSDALTRFGNHEEVVYEPDPAPLYRGRKMPRQYRLWKFILPWTERAKVLRGLADFNLNAFSLFQSEEALMETMAVSELERQAP
jgi:FRG domain